MFLGGINFALLYKVLSGGLRGSWSNEPFRVYVMAIFVIYILFAGSLIVTGAGNSFETLVIDPVFMIVSTMSSTGYTVSNFQNWGTFILLLVFVMMMFGACAGSTSGGAKLDRAIYFIKNSHNEIYRILHPNTIRPVNINGRAVSPETVNKVSAFLGLYCLVILAGGLVLTTFRIPLVDSLFTSFSCVSNTGLSADITGFGNNYDIIPSGAKWILSLLMLIGRLELFTVLVLFSPGFWRR